MIVDLLDSVAEEKGIKRAECALYPSGSASLNTIIIFGEGELEMIAKYSHLHQKRVRELSKSLSTVNTILSSTRFAGTTPEPASITTKLSEEISFQSPIEGTPIHNYLRGGNKKRKTEQTLRKVTEWLSIFHSECPCRKPKNDLPKYLPPSYKSSIDNRLFGAMHGDFVCSNVLIKNNNIRVIDWEDFDRCGFPVVDLLFFIVSIASCHCGKNPFEYSFYKKNWFSKNVKKQIYKYCSYRNLDISVARKSIPIYLKYSQYISKKTGNHKWVKRLIKIKDNHKEELLFF